MAAISVAFIRDDHGDYSVIADGSRIGFLCKLHDSGSGRALAGYVGAIKPYDYWRWIPDSVDINSMNFDKFLEAKRHIVKICSGS
jgi:hypothetical protein